MGNLNWARFTFSALLSATAPASATLVPESLRSKPSQESFGAYAQTLGSAQSITVRGVPIELPFQVRVLIKEIKQFSPDASRDIKITGTDLRDQQGRLIGRDATLNCGIYKNPLVLLNDAPFEKYPEWICRSKNYQAFLKNAKLRLDVGAGFVGVARQLFRGGLELVQKENTLLIINDLPIEPYLAGLVNKEISSSYPVEAIKAQAIAARSYALATAADRRKLGFDFDLYSTEADQVYSGSDFEDVQSYRLVKQTQGQVLIHLNNVLKAYYHASSGGFSELPQNVWGRESMEMDRLAYLARASEIDVDLADAKWSITLSPKIGLAWPDLGEINSMRVVSRSEGKRVKGIEISGTRTTKVLSGPEFRRRFGNRIIRSTYFNIEKTPKGWQITGQGFGHGVGLSQIGAKALAQQGSKAEAILKHYYPFANVETLNLEGLVTPKNSAPPQSTPLSLPSSAR